MLILFSFQVASFAPVANKMKKGGAKRTKTASTATQDGADAFILQDDGGGGEDHMSSNNRQELAYNDEDEYQDDVDYSGVLNTDNNTGPKTLLELARGPNEHAAKHIIASKVDHIAVVCYFLLHRLQNSSGGPSPHIFCEQTKEFLMAHPDIKVKAEGAGSRARPYVADGPPKDILE